MEQLKVSTAPYHQQIEQNEYARAIMKGSLTLGQYRQYLEKFYGFLLPIERVLIRRPEWSLFGFDYSLRLKEAHLTRDLTALGLTEIERQQLPLCTKLPDISTFPRILGFLYVMEGSTLGGQLIMKQLRSCLPVNPEVNGHYFSSYGPELRVRWGEFRELLLAAADSETSSKQVLEAAIETFVKLEEWIVA